MAEKRYQVFISSTFVDLKEERQAAIQAVIEMNCIPAGMELFPASDASQLEYIKRVIDDCDYYLLIVGGRYGSLDTEGISYTEREFDYAASRGLNIIALLHGEPGEIALRKSELEPQLREKLAAFRKKVSTGRVVKAWSSTLELRSHVATSLASAIRMFPAIGWVRADKAGTVELLTEINELRKETAQLVAAAAESRPKIENLASLQETIIVHGTFRRRSIRSRDSWSSSFTWSEIFALISPYLVELPPDSYVKSKLADAAFAKSGSAAAGDGEDLDDQVYRTVSLQLEALGLVKRNYLQTIAGTRALFWYITPSGESLMLELRTVKKAPEKIGLLATGQKPDRSS